MINIFVGLAGIRLSTLASHDRESLTEYIVLQASLYVVGCVERLVLAGRKEVGGRDTIDYTLEDGMEVFFEVGIGYLWRIGEGGGLAARSSGRKGGVEGTSRMVGCQAT